jgi:hypothetical protein
VYGRVIPGLAFFSLALISTQERRSFPVRIEQVVRSEAEKAASQAKAAAKQAPKSGAPRKRGRPKGRKNKVAANVTLSPELLRIQAMLTAQLTLMAGRIPLVYLVLDGHFGNHPAWHMVRQCGLHLISKLRCDAALYLPYDGPYQGHGPHRKYGDKLDYGQLPERYPASPRPSQGTLRRASMDPGPAQGVQPAAQCRDHRQDPWLRRPGDGLFSSDLTLAYDQLIDYYRLRFQIEFNFRDAKQYWGLEDFMNTTETTVTNAANLALFMVNFSQRLLADLRSADPECSILDLKALCRGAKYVAEAIKMLPEKPEPILLARIFSRLAALGRIHSGQPALSSP